MVLKSVIFTDQLVVGEGRPDMRDRMYIEFMYGPRRKYNIKMDLREISFGDGMWIGL